MDLLGQLLDNNDSLSTEKQLLLFAFRARRTFDCSGVVGDSSWSHYSEIQIPTSFAASGIYNLLIVMPKWTMFKSLMFKDFRSLKHFRSTAANLSTSQTTESKGEKLRLTLELVFLYLKATVIIFSFDYKIND